MSDLIDRMDVIDLLKVTRDSEYKKSMSAEVKHKSVIRSKHDAHVAFCDYLIEYVKQVPTHTIPSNTLGALDCVDRQDAIDAMEKINRVFYDLGLSCAYDMPSFWCHDGKDYKVIPTKYHKGYQQALSDAEKRIKLIFEELCYG